MKQKDNTTSKRRKLFLNEVIVPFLELIGGSITSRIGFSFLLIILGLVCLLSTIEGTPNKPIALIFTGYTFLTIGIILIIRKIIFLKK